VLCAVRATGNSSVADGRARCCASVAARRLLFTVVIVLFGIMNVGAALGFALDARERRAVLARLQLPEAGFRVAQDAEGGGCGGDAQCWLWSFHLDPLPDELAAPSGSAVRLSEAIGIPFARLRASMPDELIGESLAAAVGHKHAFSLQGFAACLPSQQRMSQRMGVRRTKTGRMLASSASTLQAAAAAADASSRLEELVGTALVLSFLQVAALMPVTELARRVSAAKRHFAGVTTPAGWDFAATFTAFITLISPGVLSLKHRWLVRARFWKLVLSQSTAGHWDACSTTAFALEARDAAETDALPRTLLSRLKDAVSGATEAYEDDRDVLEATMQAWQTDDGDAAAATPKAQDADDATTMATTTDVSEPLFLADAAYTDCPLTSSVSAIVASVPRRLARVRDTDADVDVTRVWTTMCCIASLQRLPICWLWGDGCVRLRLRLLRISAVCGLQLTSARACCLCAPVLRQRVVPRAGAHDCGRRARVAGGLRGGASRAGAGAGGRRAGQARQPRDGAVAARERRARRAAAPQRSHPLADGPVAPAPHLHRAGARRYHQALHLRHVSVRAAGRAAALAECVLGSFGFSVHRCMSHVCVLMTGCRAPSLRRSVHHPRVVGHQPAARQRTCPRALHACRIDAACTDAAHFVLTHTLLTTCPAHATPHTRRSGCSTPRR
jgi:hypothetical protein